MPAASDEVCGIATLTPLDMATGKLLANSDRWADDAAFSRAVFGSWTKRPASNRPDQSLSK
ncbi:MAG: hypothetical protein KFB96_03055 [Thiocapsa sp.]|uniref:hypothetical protein n=1 Tax=Thiocapsa sp. TaxID=2024551 RepID=UPI001BCE4E7E|nr:hypothetical protein [Thiocapsa sp.]QVL49510.1 MAG: hypothetical protein KFB96_03055 [Thiocapsa sp.]